MNPFDRTRVQRPEYSDLALVVGPNVRWTENGYEDLQRHHPEVLLGYRVRLFTAHDVVFGRHRGLRPEKVVVLNAAYREGPRFEDELRAAVVTGYFPKFEVWHVHRGTGIWRVL